MELAVSKGANRAACCNGQGFCQSELEDQDARVPFERYMALMRAAKALPATGLGLHYGEQVDIAEVSIIGLIGQASETALEAFQQLNRYVRLIVETANEGPAVTASAWRWTAAACG